MIRNNSNYIIHACFYCLFLITTIMGCAKHSQGMDHMKREVTLLSSKDYCETAYKNIITFGKDIIPLLIKNSSNETPFEGTIILDPASSFVIDKPSVGVVSLYLVECILKEKMRPYHVPLIVAKSDKFPYRDGKKLPQTKSENLKKAQEYYQIWWEKNKNKSIDEIRKTSPLDNTELKWF